MDSLLILELHIFLTSIFGGIIAGFIYDIYRTIRYYSKPNKFMDYIQDALFWLLITCVFFYTLIRVNWGEIRGYILLAFSIGVIIYIVAFSKYIYPMAVRSVGIMKKLIKKVIYMVLYPLRHIRKKVLLIIKKFKRVIIELVREVKKYKKIISNKK